jgi:hypothetical protein
MCLVLGAWFRKPGTRNPEPGTRNPEPGTRCFLHSSFFIPSDIPPCQIRIHRQECPPLGTPHCCKPGVPFAFLTSSPQSIAGIPLCDNSMPLLTQRNGVTSEGFPRFTLHWDLHSSLHAQLHGKPCRCLTTLNFLPGLSRDCRV